MNTENCLKVKSFFLFIRTFDLILVYLTDCA